uniref:MATH domain-containing protein n=1 Tax=Panagrellus redivivus TaxID=6233 RepID=A0A7E4V3L9_PANRE
MFSRLKTFLPTTLTSYEFEDSETLTIDAVLLNLLEFDQFVTSPKRVVPKCKNLSWRITCYPNGNGAENKGYVSLFINTSIGGFEKTMTVTLLRSDTKCTDTDTYVKPASDGWQRFVSHEKLMSNGTIRDGVITIKAYVCFKIPRETMIDDEKLEEDICVVKFNRKTMEMLKSSDAIVEEKRTFNGVNWWIQYYPTGHYHAGKRYLSLYFCADGLVRRNICAGICIDGVYVYRSFNYENTDKQGYSKFFSRKQCLRADHDNGVIDIVCKIRIDKSAGVIPSTFNFPKTSISDTITVTMVDYQLEHNDVGDFDGTPKMPVKGSAKHQWRLQYFPAGDCARSKGHISLFIEASTVETKTVTLSGVIRIAGTWFEKKFNMIVESDSYYGFPKLISHDELKEIGGIVGSKIVITCKATFTTHQMAILD